MTNMTNPLLDGSGLPRFDTIASSDVQPAITELLTQTRSLVERLTDDAVPARWTDFAAPLSDGIEHLSNSDRTSSSSPNTRRFVKAASTRA